MIFLWSITKIKRKNTEPAAATTINKWLTIKITKSENKSRNQATLTTLTLCWLKMVKNLFFCRNFNFRLWTGVSVFETCVTVWRLLAWLFVPLTKHFIVHIMCFFFFFAICVRPPVARSLMLIMCCSLLLKWVHLLRNLKIKDLYFVNCDNCIKKSCRKVVDSGSWIN